MDRRRYLDSSFIEDTFSYWIIFDENTPSTQLESGGNDDVRQRLRSKFKRCMAMPQANGKAAIAYLNDSDSTLWPDGSASVASDLEDGKYVMVHFPRYYYRSENLGNNRYKFYISDKKINGNYKKERECLMGAFEAYINSSVSRLCSAYGVLSSADTTIDMFYQYAQNNGRKWGLIDYRAHKTIANMFCIMYGNTDISTSNSSIPCSGGYKRYNMGSTGGTITLGNRDGLNTAPGAGTKSSNFLGLEDCYYGKWELTQGVNIKFGGTDRVVYDGGCFPDKFDSALTSAGATNVRTISTGLIDSGCITKIVHGEYGDVMPSAVGGSDTTYYADYNYGCEWMGGGPFVFLRSGYSKNGSYCGVFMSNACTTPSQSSPGIGSRLAFYGDIEVKTKDEWLALKPDFTG